MQQILLVDDSPLQLQTREAVLREAGFPVSVATTAESALALLRTEPLASSIGLVVTDHFMPGASGADFVRQMRTVKPQLPVLVVSGMPGAEEEYTGLNVAFRMKPCPPPELILLARRMIGHSQAA